MPGAKICARSALSPRGDGVVMATADGFRAAGEVPSAPSTPVERLSLWCGHFASRGPETLRTLAAQGEHFTNADELAAALGRKADRRSLEFRDRRFAQQWPDRNRRSDLTEPRHSFASKLFTVPKSASQQVQDSFSGVP